MPEVKVSDERRMTRADRIASAAGITLTAAILAVVYSAPGGMSPWMAVPVAIVVYLLARWMLNKAGRYVARRERRR